MGGERSEAADPSFWPDVAPGPQAMTAGRIAQALRHPRAARAFGGAVQDLRAADATVLLLPADGGAHLELGYAVARGQKTVVLLEPHGADPVLPYKLAGLVTDDFDAVESYLFGARTSSPPSPSGRGGDA